MTDTTKDGYDLRADGSVVLVFAGQTSNIPPVKLGAYKQIRGFLDEVQSARTSAVDGGHVATFVDEIDDATQVLEKSFELLGVQVPPADDWPAWVAGGTFLGKLLSHWRTVPLALGEKSA